MAAVLPDLELDQTASTLANIPGFDGSTGRRQLLRLLGTVGPGGAAIPDQHIESGWRQVLDYLAQPPASEAYARLRKLLADLRQVAGTGDADAALAAADERIAALADDRSFRIFLARIGVRDQQADSSGIAQVDRVFVPPAQYDRAIEILERDHVVCLFGDPHMGKTYCAIRILWEYFSGKGYDPYWQRVASPMTAQTLNFAELTRIGTIVYIEDPFGRTGPAEDIDSIIREVRHLIIDAERKDVRIVITSRSAVFRTAVADRLNPFIVTLSQELLVDKSYDQASLERIVDHYLSYMTPAWALTGDRAAIIRVVADKLPAPHNIKEFVAATRDEPDPATALRRLADFRDIVQEFANTFGKLDDWLLDALLLITAAGDLDLGQDALTALYDGLQPNRAPYRTFAAAVRSLGDNVTSFNSGREGKLYLPRHPSLGEALEALTRRDESRLEATWLLIELCHDRTMEAYGLVAIRLLANYADRWATEPGRLQLLAGYFESAHLTVRTWSRRAILNRFDQVSRAAADIVVELAQRSWGDRFLVMLIFQPSQLDDELYLELAMRLARSNDAQTRFLLADWIGGPLRSVASSAIADALCEDVDELVRRMAIVRIVEHGTFGRDSDGRIVGAACELAGRHRRWIAQMIAGLNVTREPARGIASAMISALTDDSR